MANYNKSFNFRNGVQVDNDHFVINPNGLVGIGSTTPIQALDVVGNINVSGFVTAPNLYAKILSAPSAFITTVTAGIVTAGYFYGDGSNITNIRANVYSNLRLSDLPTTSEPTFAQDRVLMVNDTATGYLLNDPHQLDVYKLRSFGISNDPTVYTGTASIVSNKLQISGISTSRFVVGQKVKVFGATDYNDNTLVESPVLSVCSATKVGSSAVAATFFYWVAQYDLRYGKVGPAAQINPTAGIQMAASSDWNDLNNIFLSLGRTNTNYGLLIYRQETTSNGSANINNAQLVAILGPKEMGSSTSGINWNDYGPYERTDWTSKDSLNEYTSNQIHFPNVAVISTKNGWVIDQVASIGSGSITLSNPYKINGDTIVKVTHDNTYGFSRAINSIVASGGNYLDIPSGTYLTNNINIPDGFTLKGNGKNTVIKQQYFATDYTDGGGNSLSFNGNVIGSSAANPSNITIKDITIDGNFGNNILFNSELDNYLVYLPNITSSLLDNIEIRNSPGHGLYVYNSTRLSIEDSSFVDGTITTRYNHQPLTAQQSQTLRVNDCLFENYPGPVDLSVTSVVSTGGNIIRNCGTGLRTYASRKITTTNNIILGPSDEWIPSPDIYDSSYNSINFTIQRGVTFNSPVLLYLENGNPKDISSTKVSIISAGIGVVLGQGTANETLDNRFLNFNVITPDAGTFGRQNGYIQLNLTSTQTNTLGLSSSLGYNIIAKEFLTQPTGFTTYIGISTGTWDTIGPGATQYTVTLYDYTQFSGISVGDVVKLVNHSVSPDLSSYELVVAEKIDADAITKQLRLTGITATSVTNGNQSGYISIANIFTIAKGRIGVI
jgi:hypothetical protein